MITNRQYIEAQLSALNLDGSSIEALALGGAHGDKPLDLEAKAVPEQCDLAIYAGFGQIYASVLANVSEGGYSVNYNLDAIKLYYRSLCVKLKKPNTLERAGRARYRSF